MAAQSILDIYDSVEEFAGILASAELHASGEWEPVSYTHLTLPTICSV